MNTIIDKVDSGITTQVFENATFYTMEAFGAARKDCKHLTVQFGVKYAQYDNAIRLTYLAKGKRKPQSRILTYKPYLLVVHTKDAIPVPNCMDDKGGGCSQTRYATFDDRWLSDWESQSKEMTFLLKVNDKAK